MIMRPGCLRRGGWASVFALVVLAVLSAMIALAAQNVASARRLLRDRSANIQARWLARAGLEIGMEKLKNDADYIGEVVEPIPGSKVTILVTKSPELRQAQIVSDSQFEGTGTNRPKASVARTIDLAATTERNKH